MTDSGTEHPSETEKQRVDRELIELLNELRVALPGIQVLFAFLLIVPFQQTFSRVTEFQRDVYFVTLLLTAIALALLVAPSVQHRILFRAADKQELLIKANDLAIAGTAVLAAAIVGVLVLISDLLFHAGTVIVVAAAAVVLFAGLWFVVPLRRR